ncbi:MAG: hypothetical protein ACRCU2_01070 [Planktothrix sp.]
MIKTLFALTGFVVFGSVFAQPVFSQTAACDRAINHISTTLQENGNIDMEFRVRNNPETAPPDRPAGLQVLLGSRTSSQEQRQRIRNIINSPQLLISLTRNVINNCDQVSTVDYGLRNTDFGKTFGLIDGEIKEFECIYSIGRNTSRPRWGQVICL